MLFVLLNGFFGVHVIPVDPLIVQLGVSLPLYEVLLCLPSSKDPGVENVLHLKVFFIPDKVRWGVHVVFPVECHFPIWGEQVHLKHQVDLPVWGKSQLIVDGR